MFIPWVALNIILFIAALYGLYRLRRHGMRFSFAVLIATGGGILLGTLLLLVWGGRADILERSVLFVGMVGTVYINLLKMLIIPIVLVAIASSILDMHGKENVGKISLIIIAVLLGTTALSSLIAIGISGFSHLTADSILNAQNAVSEEAVAHLQDRFSRISSLEGIIEQLLNVAPSNIFFEMTGGRPTSTIAVVIFSSILGFAGLRLLRTDNPSGPRFQVGMRTFKDVVMSVTRIILDLTPYGVFALMVKFVATSSWGAIAEMLKFLAIIYVTLLALMVMHLAIVMLLRLNPLTFLQKAAPALIYAFSSRSSLGTVPLTSTALSESMGVSSGIASLSASYGANIGQNACGGAYPTLLVMMVAPVMGIDPFSAAFIIKLVVVVALSSFGVAGVGAGATFASLLVLSIMGLPIEIIGVMIAIEPIVDMGRTLINVEGAMVAGLVTAQAEGGLDRAAFAQPADSQAIS